jgi:TRAP-type C4-dicarboxylate transport system substrate-binding protein
VTWSCRESGLDAAFLTPKVELEGDRSAMRLHPISGAAIVALLLSPSALVAEPKDAQEGLAQPRELRITVQTPKGSINNDNLELFNKRVETATEGALKISIHVGLVEDSQVIKAVAAGRVEMGGSRIGHFAEAVPAIGIFLLPFMFNLLPVQDAALQTDSPFRRPLDSAVLEKTGARVLWWSPFGTSIMASKSVPITSPAAMAGKTVRTYDKISETLVRSCGGIPVYLGGTEQYNGYKTGKAVAGQMGITFVVARRMWEVLDTVADTRHFADGMLILINEPVWQSLLPEHRRIVAEAAAEAQKAILVDLQKREIEGYALAAKNGMKVHEITPDEVAEWRVCSAPVLEAFMSKSGELGQRLMDAYGRLRTQPCCSGGTPGVFTRR